MKKIKPFILGLIVGLMMTSFAFASNEQIQAIFTDLKLMINGKSITLETKPLLYNGTSYLPVREISNLLGYDVNYEADTKTILLNNSNTLNDVKSTNNLSNLSEDWISIRDLVERYSIKVSSGETLIIEKDKITITAKLDNIQDGYIYKLTDINNPNIEISFCQNNGRSFIFMPDLKKLGIIN